MRRETGCDGVMIAEEVHREIHGSSHETDQEYERTGVVPPRPTPEENQRDMMLRHARLQLNSRETLLGIREMRKHVAWYTKGMKGSAKLTGMQ